LRGQLRRALAGLSRATFAESVQTAERDVVLVVVTGAYVVFSLVLALVLGLTVLPHGVSASAFLAIAVGWLVQTRTCFRVSGAGTRVSRGPLSPQCRLRAVQPDRFAPAS
jgi:hypothetical protein